MPEEIKAEGFVRPGNECADKDTNDWVLAKAKEIIGRKAETPKAAPKYTACLADFIRTLQKTPSGIFAWPMNDENYQGAVYGRDIAERVRDRLKVKGVISVLQTHSRGLSTVYKANPALFPDWLSFKKSRSVNLVKVRGASQRVNGRLKKGRMIPIRKFRKDAVAPLVEQMKTINSMMERYPLAAPDGSVWDTCYRQFNGGDDTAQEWRNLGGRLYGDWQNKKAQERLGFSLGGQPVCEIDIKACYLSLANQLSGQPRELPDDPYQTIGFVVDHSSRELAKRLVSCLLSKKGAMTRFPQGTTGVSFRQEFNIPKHLKVGDYLNDIFSSYPFLKDFDLDGLELMFHESELMVQSLLTLAEQDIPAYPVHDCLICQRDDEAVVVDVLGSKFRARVGGTVILEIEVEGQVPRIVRPWETST